MSEITEISACESDNFCANIIVPTQGGAERSLCPYLDSKSCPSENLGHGDVEDCRREELIEKLILSWLRELPPPPKETPKLLPSLEIVSSSMPTLVLDLDQTLIYSSVGIVPGCQDAVSITFCGSDAWVHPRPGLEDFLRQCRIWYDEIILWTAGKTTYALTVINNLGIQGYFDHLLFNKDCYMKDLLSIIPSRFRPSDPDTEIEYKTKEEKKLPFKPLSLLNREHCFLLDDSKEMIAFNHSDQILPIAPFTGDCNDRELVKLLPLMKQLSESRTLRTDIASYQAEVAEGQNKY